MKKRYIADCRNFDGSTCTVTIAGSKEEVLPLAMHHAIETHGHKNTPELRREIESMLVEETEAVPA